MEWLVSLVLGAVQGVTEFLPISSDGHLNVAKKIFTRLTGSGRPEKENLFFFVMLHVGTLASIVFYYRKEWLTASRGLLGARDVPLGYQRSPVLWVGLLAAVATSPLIPLKLFFMKWIEQTFEGIVATGIGFLITAAVLLLTVFLHSRSSGGKGPAETTLLDALLIGIAQMFAPLPGVSRSGLTVATALGLGLSRTWAVGFSLLLAVPAITGAAVFEIRHVDPKTLTGDRVAQTVVAAIVAGAIGYGAIVWLLRIVNSGRMWYFSVYLVVLASAVLAVALIYGEPPSAGHANPAVGAFRGGGPGPADRGVRAQQPWTLDRPNPAGRDAASGIARAQDRTIQGIEGLVLGRPLAAGR